MTLAARQRAVVIAESDVQRLRSELLTGEALLRRRVFHEWAPRALVAGGAALGFWIEGRTSHGKPNGGSSGGIRSTANRAAGEGLGTASPVSIALWLGVAETALRMFKQIAPSLQRPGSEREDAGPAAGQSRPAPSSADVATHG